ncbi:hypothetical protein [Fulvivirga lutea]|uniref:Uncharacterized protein n=1 Tax=Fulvivirga lutea TaxID=2810512 RepID=A0A975A0S0_9BACT|nr:hypothetical protein [Fulvivirga lutea]QSE96747.1 hypothetical protein JR347_14250 [Fulvivirga lutea]
MKFISIALLLLSPAILLAQQEPDKIEIEERISEDEVPDLVKQRMSMLFDTKAKIKWYQERNESFQNFEAKVVKNKRRYSIEFDTLFNIQDIEVEYDLDELSEETKTGLTNYFDSNYSSYKIRRIQLQLSGDFESLAKYCKEGILDQLRIRYEIEFEGKEEDSFIYYEGLFEKSGSLVKRRHIILNTSDNISY